MVQLLNYDNEKIIVTIDTFNNYIATFKFKYITSKHTI